MKKIIILITFMANLAFAKRLEDVLVLGRTPVKEGVELKLRLKSAAEDSFFFVTLIKRDQGYSEKLALINTKADKGPATKLSMEIPSFSAFPSGSRYFSDSVKMNLTSGDNN